MRLALKTLALLAATFSVSATASQPDGKGEICTAPPASGTNALTAREKAQGWKLLWDGKTSKGWRSASAPGFPEKGWTMCGGVLTIGASDGEESRGGGDIITIDRYSDFELLFDFRITPGANSGVKIFVQTDISPIDRLTGKPTPIGSGIGMEFQLLDDARHPDAKAGRDGNRTIGSFYDVIPASADKQVLAPGNWNRGRIVSEAGRVTFYLNGRKTVDFLRGSPDFSAAVSGSKFRNIDGFGEWPDGHILLQDHGDTVSFANLKIRKLGAGK